MRPLLNCCIYLFLIMIVPISGTAQTQAQIEQGKAKLGTMSPAEIDAKIKELGMTRGEAEAKAQQYGVDLESFLTKARAPAATSAQSQPQPQTTVIVQQNPAASSPQASRTDSLAAAAPLPQTPTASLVAQESATKNLPAITPAEEEIYGLSFFRRAASSFQPSPSIVDKEYIVGAGDVLKISLWGQLQSTQEVEVSQDGTITLSTGPVLVSGYSIYEAKKRIIADLSQAYAGLVSKPPSIFFDLSLSKLRPVRVFLMGEVENPGGYFVNNFANVFNSLFVVGGPKASGSMRDVRVIRNNKVVRRVDLYDYLIGAQKTNDTRVNDNDIIFVPLRGRTVSITGAVLRPAKYELLPDEDLKKLIDFSGGLRASVYKDRIQIDRIIPMSERVKGGEERKIFDVGFAEIATGKKDFSLEDGDIVTLYPVLDRKENFVTIEGDVKRPGTYQFDKLKTVKDLIDAADGLWPTAYLDRAELLRQFPNEKLEVITLDLRQVLADNPAHNIKLLRRDKLRIYSLNDINGPKTISISGHVKSPGSYPYADSITIYGLLLSWGGFEDSLFKANTFLDRGDIFRLNDDLVTRRVVQFSLSDILDRKVSDFPIIPGDEIRIYGIDEVKYFGQTIEIYGSVKKPGTYKLLNDMTLPDLILQAGGYTQDAWTVKAEIARMTRNPGRKDSLVTIIFTQLPDLFDTTRSAISVLSSPPGLFRLIDKDQVFIRPNPDYRTQQLVTVDGEVNHPGKYALDLHAERLSHLLIRAGGLTLSGYARGARLTRNGVQLRLNIEEALNDAGGPNDIVLNTGDVISVPPSPGTVTIRGEVQNPGVYGYVRKESFSDYLDRAGGKTDSSDFAVITFPEGDSKQVGLGWFSRNPTIPDGSSILVTKVKPEKPEPPEVPGEKTSTLELLKDIAYMTVTVLTIIILSKQAK